jgi:uncharacterized membrane protein HdeD (DUF308 family)
MLMSNPSAPDPKRLRTLGITLIVLGIIAVVAPVIAGGTVVIIIGGLMLLAGIGQIYQGWNETSGSSKLMSLILGFITALAGVLVLGHPLLGLSFLTLLLAAFFVVEGIWKIVVSFSYRPATGWVWMLIGGGLSVVLGMLIWNQWPVSGMWAVGLLVGIDLLSTGTATLAVASTLRSVDTGNRAVGT